ncbi:hypothetical protein A200_03724 [Parascardovia denticolens IPLA 20019]|nr:hypothetical protein A200_03724 [Parascardovia denticolens IPLA 20019]
MGKSLIFLITLAIVPEQVHRNIYAGQLEESSVMILRLAGFYRYGKEVLTGVRFIVARKYYGILTTY